MLSLSLVIKPTLEAAFSNVFQRALQFQPTQTESSAGAETVLTFFAKNKHSLVIVQQKVFRPFKTFHRKLKCLCR